MVDSRALDGALVADAAAMGLHWLYDQQCIARVEASGDVVFRAADAAHYHEQKGYFAHAGRRSGEGSHYGEMVRIAAGCAAAGDYSVAAHQQAFFASFGPGGSFCGYADRPTKALIARMLTEQPCRELSGADDDQLPALCAVPGLFAAGCSLPQVLAAVRMTNVHTDADAAATALYTALEQVRSGIALPEALVRGAEAAGGTLGDLLSEALAHQDYAPLQLGEHFGLPCHVPQGLPVAWHLLQHAQDYRTPVRDNVRIGGDSCGRAMAVGSLAGQAFGVPDDWLNRLTPATNKP